MSTISWNCRGMGNPRTVRMLMNLVSKFRPEFIFLMEVKCNRAKIESIKRKLCYDGLFFIDPINQGGGLALLWKLNGTVNLLRASRNFIDVKISLMGLSEYRLTGFYGFPERPRRFESWDMIRDLYANQSLPWVIIGDFNDLALQSEKRGGRRHPQSLLNGFSEVIDQCFLVEIPMAGHEFTWEKSRGSMNFVEEKLDRGLASSSWHQIFPSAKILNEEAHASDHSALILLPVPIESFGVRKFRFENAWIREAECRDRVVAGWNVCSAGDIIERQQVCGEHLFQWGEELRRQFSRNINDCKSEIGRLKARLDSTSQGRLVEVRSQLDSLLLQQELYWKQRAKKMWLEGGDMNSKFFHAAANNRKKKIRLIALRMMRESGVVGLQVCLLLFIPILGNYSLLVVV
ncbi:hypothetical protein M5689_022794 [Euphorbia peplus]|nr:hypothetical protein M5689_022794 [Euphorbia peplus]